MLSITGRASTRRPLLRLPPTLLLAVALVSIGSLTFGQEKVRPGVGHAIDADGHAVVFVSFDPATSAGSATYTREIARVQEDIISLAGAGDETCVRYRYRYIPAVVFDADDLAVLERVAELPEVSGIYLDEQGKASLDESIPFIRADLGYQLGVHGSGAVAAVLDSGIVSNHPALEAARMPEFERHFLSQGDDIGEDVEDGDGHGTHVSGIIASRGAPIGPVPAGVASGARLISIKVLDDEARGWVSDWCRGLDEILALHLEEQVSIDVVNMSLVLDLVFETREDCEQTRTAFADACRLAFESGIVLFGASGNSGASDAVSLPACYSSVIAVGSITDDGSDTVSDFTDRGELLDLLAPGENITGAGLEAQNFVVTKTGTSQACPHAAAVACLMRQADPELSSEEIREILLTSGRRVYDLRSSLDYPVLDAWAALEAVIAPVIEDLLCDGPADSILARWRVDGEAVAQRLRIVKDGQPFRDTLIPGTVTSFEEPVEDGEYAICLQPLGGENITGAEVCCTVVVDTTPSFRRGDCTGDGWIDISDVVGLLWSTFSATRIPLCLMACDANDDREVDISDAVSLLNHIFRGQAPPPPPFPACGSDRTTGDLDCQVSPCGRDA